MSLHAQLSPEAEARLQAQRRQSTVSSVLIGLLTIALIGVILLIINMTMPATEFSGAVIYQSPTIEEEELPEKTVNVTTRRKPASPSPSASRMIVAHTASPTMIPVPEAEFPQLLATIGNSDGIGTGWSAGSDGSGITFNNLERTLSKRCGLKNRLERLANNGGNPQCEDAVVKALRWLQKTQNKDGSWTDRYQVGMTGLALLAYLGHCETASSEEFGDTVLAALSYLINVGLEQDGRLTMDLKDKHWPYEHAIATYALAEAYTFCVKIFHENIPNLDAVVKTSGQVLIDHQHDSGGWEYSYSVDNSRGGDTSIVGWHLQALKAMKHTGLSFKKLTRASREGLDYLENRQVPSGAVAYTGNRLHHDGTTLAAVGALCFQIWDQSSAPFTRKACRFIDRNMKFDWDGPDSDLYGHYYAAQAMMNYGGDYWKRYNKLFRDQVLANQNEDGSFRNVARNGQIHASGARFKGSDRLAVHYRTCLATLMLEVYYRFLPATGQKTSG